MAKVVLFHNPRCSKSRAALALVQEKGVAVEIVDYVKQPYSLALLQEICVKSGLAPRDLVRKGEALYKELALGDKEDDELLAAMVEHPILVERPILLSDTKAAIGRPPENILPLLP